MVGGYAQIDFKNSAAGTITDAKIKEQFVAACQSKKPIIGYNFAAGHGPGYMTQFENSTAYQLAYISTPTYQGKNATLYHYTYTKATGALVLATVALDILPATT